ncbi:hypothetical protein ETAA8_33110 [Anatilimnocola aggregata]|uniref:Uncharacterized protein n=1 Tax=Anatilimnocola aggregata TaxID=2528021 RepID=A0A517YDA1_9BACT|nr:hypothetical protein [Anatilimnocola aggregata]QDU28211.1 hypothetical protein ETAA8_33110 [Anatilimnocola aggregata]
MSTFLATTRSNDANSNKRVVRVIALLLVIIAGLTSLRSAEPDYVPKLGEFPPVTAGEYFAGELVAIDHVNRRGALRLDGDGVDDRYHHAESHRFAMLPYGMIRYHGAPAELRDIPIGTHLHGKFVLPPDGDQSIPPTKRTPKYVPKQNHALLLEDDFSFYLRQGQSWRVEAVDPVKGRLKVTATGQSVAVGLKGEQNFDFDGSTRVWKGRQIGGLNDLAPEQVVQVNLTWAPDWKNGQFHVADVWIDQESREVASEVQRQIHIRHQRHRWLAGWVDHVEHQAAGKGIVTVTLFGGMDNSLYDLARAQAKPGGGAALAAGEPTLRTWWQEHDSKSGPVLDFKDIPNPPPGSSGLQLRVQIDELLEGYRPGRIIRFRPNGFPSVKLPPEERVKSLDDR